MRESVCERERVSERENVESRRGTAARFQATSVRSHAGPDRVRVCVRDREMERDRER